MTKVFRNRIPKVDISATGRMFNQRVGDMMQVAGENANARAPLDSGDLRRSMRIVRSYGKHYAKWSVPYAGLRYRLNKKNPQTTEWADKDFRKNGKRYAEYIAKREVTIR